MTGKFIIENSRGPKGFNNIKGDSMFEIYGLFFGYPECCVKQFTHDVDNGISTKGKKLWGTGYIPCNNCNTTKTEQQLIDNINKRRSYSKAFPSRHPCSADDEIRHMIKRYKRR